MSASSVTQSPLSVSSSLQLFFLLFLTLVPQPTFAALPVHLPSLSIHGWAPSACAVDETRDEFYIVDDNTGLTVLSASNGSVLRSVQGIPGTDHTYVGIWTMTVIPSSSASSRPPLVWLSVVDSDFDDGSYYYYLVVVRGDDFSLVRNVSHVSPAATRGPFATLALDTDDSSLMYALSRGYLYTFNSTTGVQLGDGFLLPDASGDVMAIGRTAASPTTLFVLYHHRESTLVVSNLDGDRLRDVTLALSVDTVLNEQMHVDEQERLWLIDMADSVYCLNSTSGAVLFTFHTATSSAVMAPFQFPWYHQFAVSFDSSRVWITTYGAPGITVQSLNGTEMARWLSPQVVTYSPYTVQVDETTTPSTLLYADFLSAEDSTAASIWRLSQTGTTVQRISVSSAGDQSFQPWTLSVDAGRNSSERGDIYVFSDSYTDELSVAYRLNITGQMLSSFPTPYGHSVAWDQSDGGSSFWMLDWVWSSVGRYSKDGTLLTLFNVTRPAQLNGLAQSCTAAGDCTLFVSDSGKQRIDLLNGTTGKLLGSIDQCKGDEAVFGLALDGRSQILYAVHCWVDHKRLDPPYYCSVRVQTTNGSPVATLQSETGYANPNFLSIALNADGSRLYAADLQNNRVLSWDTSSFQRLTDSVPSHRHPHFHRNLLRVD